MRVLMLMHVTMLPPLCARFNEKAMIVHRCLARGTCGQCVLFGNAAMLSLLCYLYTATFAIYTMLSILCYLWHTILAMLLLVLLLLPLPLLLLLLLLLLRLLLVLVVVVPLLLQLLVLLLLLLLLLVLFLRVRLRRQVEKSRRCWWALVHTPPSATLKLPRLPLVRSAQSTGKVHGGPGPAEGGQCDAMLMLF